MCAENGIDPADIRHVSATEPYRSLIPKLEPDTAFQREMTEAMRNALD